MKRLIWSRQKLAQNGVGNRPQYLFACPFPRFPGEGWEGGWRGIDIAQPPP